MEESPLESRLGAETTEKDGLGSSEQIEESENSGFGSYLSQNKEALAFAAASSLAALGGAFAGVDLSESSSHLDKALLTYSLNPLNAAFIFGAAPLAGFAAGYKIAKSKAVDWLGNKLSYFFFGKDKDKLIDEDIPAEDLEELISHQKKNARLRRRGCFAMGALMAGFTYFMASQGHLPSTHKKIANDTAAEINEALVGWSGQRNAHWLKEYIFGDRLKGAPTPPAYMDGSTPLTTEKLHKFIEWHKQTFTKEGAKGQIEPSFGQNDNYLTSNNGWGYWEKQATAKQGDTRKPIWVFVDQRYDTRTSQEIFFYDGNIIAPGASDNIMDRRDGHPDEDRVAKGLIINATAPLSSRDSMSSLYLENDIFYVYHIEYDKTTGHFDETKPATLTLYKHGDPKPIIEGLKGYFPLEPKKHLLIPDEKQNITLLYGKSINGIVVPYQLDLSGKEKESSLDHIRLFGDPTPGFERRKR